MKKKNVFKAVALCVVIAMTMLALAACGGSGGDSAGSGTSGEAKYTLKFANQDAEGQPSTNAMEEIAKQVKEKTNGEVQIDLYPSNQLGEAKLLYEGIMDGSVDMYIGYMDPTYSKNFDVVTIPFLASNYDEIAYVVSKESNTYQIVNKAAEDSNMKFLGFFMNGVNGIFSTKDMGDWKDTEKSKDLLVRVPSSKITQAGVEALGYKTVTIPWSDTYTSLQTGVMDAMTGIPSYMIADNFGDLVKVHLPINMFMESNVMVMSPKTAEKLPEDYVKIIEEVCAEVGEKSIGETEKNVLDGEKELKDKGVDVIEVTDADREAVAEKVRDKTKKTVEDYFGKDVTDKVYEDIANASK